MIFDDIGSFPLPEGISKDWVEKNYQSKEYAEMVKRAFIMKQKAGVELPNYPQFRDMNEMFLEIIRDENKQEEPFVVKRDEAVIVELEVLKEMRVEAVRVCVTGPFELYYREFGSKIYDDVLEAFGKSVARFVEKACEWKAVKCVSLDEPSLGTNPELQPNVDQIQIAYEKIKASVDVQIHLHSPVFYREVLEVDTINVIGIEAARDEKAMDFVDAEEIESYEKFLRVGVARSDFDAMIAEYNAKTGENIWGDVEKMEKALDEIESVERIRGRLKKAVEKFGERLKYIGADCGLMSFYSQELAFKHLKKIKEAKEGLQ